MSVGVQLQEMMTTEGPFNSRWGVGGECCFQGKVRLNSAREGVCVCLVDQGVGVEEDQ